MSIHKIHADTHTHTPERDKCNHLFKAFRKSEINVQYRNYELKKTNTHTHLIYIYIYVSEHRNRYNAKSARIN